MKDEAREEDDEEVMGVPEDFEVAASDDLHGGRDDEDEGQSDDDSREAGDGGEDKVSWNLLRVLGHKKKKRVTMQACVEDVVSLLYFLFATIGASTFRMKNISNTLS